MQTDLEPWFAKAFVVSQDLSAGLARRRIVAANPEVHAE